MARSRPNRRAHTKKVNLALQGGGSHGAFAWGVLDRLFEDDRIEVEGIVGTSAGAMNAAVVASGLARGGGSGAREALRTFWSAVAALGSLSPMQPSWVDRFGKPGSLTYSPGWAFMTGLSQLFSPYQSNPLNIHPLRQILAMQVDFELLRTVHAQVFVCATNVLTNRLRVFDVETLCVDALLASACMPNIFQAVSIDGEHYWDGGYLGNPPLFPLLDRCRSRDILLILLNPICIPEVPRTAQAVLDRINTVSFNSSLMREMRAIEFVNRLVDRGFDDGGRLKRVLIHCVDAEADLATLSASSKLNATPEFISWLFELGHARGNEFLDSHFDKIGIESSTSVQHRFL